MSRDIYSDRPKNNTIVKFILGVIHALLWFYNKDQFLIVYEIQRWKVFWSKLERERKNFRNFFSDYRVISHVVNQLVATPANFRFRKLSKKMWKKTRWRKSIWNERKVSGWEKNKESYQAGDRYDREKWKCEEANEKIHKHHILDRTNEAVLIWTKIRLLSTVSGRLVHERYQMNSRSRATSQRTQQWSLALNTINFSQERHSVYI